jgi:hypothetical protein
MESENVTNKATKKKNTKIEDFMEKKIKTNYANTFIKHT